MKLAFIVSAATRLAVALALVSCSESAPSTVRGTPPLAMESSAGSAGSAAGGIAAGGASGGTGGAVTGGQGGSAGGAGASTAGVSGGGVANGGGSTSGTAGTQAAGGRSYSTEESSFFGSPRCDGFEVCESFESTAVGSLPSGFSLSGYGTRTVGVSETMAARGERSLSLQFPAQGSVTAWLRRGDLGALAGSHWGRVFVRIEQPAPPQFVHFDVFAGLGPWSGHTNEVRWASTGTGVGTSSDKWSWIYNVQPSGSGAGDEFATEGDRSAHAVTGEFMCLEWWFSADEQEARFFSSGSEVTYLHIDSERAEIPVFDQLAVGFGKYQSTDAFQVYVDEVAFDSERIGCNN